MKKMILMLSLIAPVHAFANSCFGNDYVVVRYYIRNLSEYTIGLKFAEPEHGDNPDSLIIKSHSYPVEVYGCSNGFMTGYKTRAALVVYGKKNVDLAYLHIDKPVVYGEGFISYKNQDIYPPLCSCEVRVGVQWTIMKSYDCSFNNIPMDHNGEGLRTGTTMNRVAFYIVCK